MIETALKLVAAGKSISQEEMFAVMGEIIEGRAGEAEVVRFLAALHQKGESFAEVAGAALALRQRMTPIRTRRSGLLDTCGTGGDGSQTFNISTAAALVAAAAGVAVAKHGNRGITSRSGSADVLAALGVNIEADVSCVEACLEELGICFCFAPLLHQAMRQVAPIRKQLPHPTIFNVLGPLVNPASAPFQLLGVGRTELRPLMAQALALLGTRRAVVVHGADGLDEVTLSGPTYVTEVTPDTFREMVWRPEDFGVGWASREALLVEGPQHSAAVIREVLAGRPGPPLDIVVVNAAAALWTAGWNSSLLACARHAREAILSGAARELLDRLAARTNRPSPPFR
jgi:anthranilate phosphoribosyltransferase